MFHPGRTTGGIDEVIIKYKDMVYRLALARTHSRQDAEDIFQDVFLKVAKMDQEFESEEHFRSYLIRMVINASTSLHRILRRYAALPEAYDKAAEEVAPDFSGLYSALSRLKKDDRTIIHLYYYMDMTTDEIARAMHMKSASVRSRLARSRRKLKDYLNDEEG